MFTGWMIAGMFLGAIAIVIVWAVIIALIVTWIEDRHRHRHA